MSDADGSIVLTTSRRKSLLMLVGSMSLVAVGVILLMTGDQSVVVWLAVIFFGACAFVFVWQVIAPGQLVVTRSTVELSQFGRRWSRDLARCGPFEVWRNPAGPQSLVVFDHPDDTVRRFTVTSRRYSGRSSALPDTYGMSAADLAQMLNEARNRALSDGR